jgi:hypothetical protein
LIDLGKINTKGLTMKTEFKIGQRVKTKGSFTCPPRRGRIGQITTNSYGHLVYILTDGGMFSANELQAD